MAKDNTVLYLLAAGAAAYFLFPKQAQETVKKISGSVGSFVPDAAGAFVDASYNAGYNYGSEIRQAGEAQKTADLSQFYSDYPGYSDTLIDRFRLGWNLSPLGGIFPWQN